MPPKITRSTVTRSDYGNPFVGPVDHTNQLAVVVSGLTAAEVDAKGYLKPGLPLAADGTTIGIAPDYAYGAVVEATKVADGNTAALLTAAGTKRVAVARSGLLNQDIVEDNLGRALTADELAGIRAAASRLALV